MKLRENIQYVKVLHVEYAHATLKKRSISVFLIAIYRAKSMTLIFDLQCLGVLHIVDENKRHIWNPEESLSQKHMLLIQKY